MATILALAEFSRAAYGDPAPNGWTALEPCAPNEHEYFGQAYQNNVTGEIVITNRGTRPTSLQDLLSDLQLSVGIVTGAQEDAVIYALTIARNPLYSGYPIIETGHSLGGNEAQAATVALAEIGATVSAVTFNSPGIGGYPVGNATYNVLNLYDQGDVVHLAGGIHLGKSAEIPAGPDPTKLAFGIPLLAAGLVGAVTFLGKVIWDILGTAHSIDTMVSYLASDPLGQENWPGTSSIALPGDQSNHWATVNPDGSVILTDAAGDTFQYSTDAQVFAWSKPDGSSGSNTLNFDGSSIETTIRADGVSSTHSVDVDGNTLTQNYDASTTLVRSYRNNVDGSTGVTTTSSSDYSSIFKNADGGFSYTSYSLVNNASHNPAVDGFTSTINANGSGSGTSHFTDGSLAGAWIINANGSGSFTGNNKDGSLAYECAINADKSVTYTVHETNGIISTGSLSADGSGSGTDYVPDGRMVTWTRDASNGMTYTQYAPDGTLVGSSNQSNARIYNPDGTSFISLAVGVGESYRQDGSISSIQFPNSGISYYPDGSISGIWARNPDLTDTSAYFNGDGSLRSGNFVNAGQVGIYSGSDGRFQIGGGSYGATNYYYSPDGSSYSYSMNADKSYTYTSYGTTGLMGSRYTQNPDFTLNSSYNYFPDGSIFSEYSSSADGSHSTIYHNADGTISSSDVVTINADGSSTHTWSYSDGNHSTSTTYSDGSSSGLNYKADGSYTSFINDGLGSVTTNFFGASDNALGLSVSINDAQGNPVSTIYGANGIVLGVATGSMAQQVLPAGASAIQFVSSISSADLAVSQDSQGNFLISCNNGTGTLDISAQSAVTSSVEASFANGTSWQFVNAAGSSYDFIAGSGVTYLINPSSVQFGAGITSSMITLGLGSLMLRVGNSGDLLHIEGINPADALNSGVLQSFTFADGTTLSYSDLLARGFDIYGTTGDEILTGTNLNDRIYGDDGNDTLQGGVGNDTYLFNLGGGQDTINDGDSTIGNLDTIRFGAGIVASDITFSRSRSNLVLGTNGTGDQLTIQNWGSAEANRIERVEFADGTVWDAAYLQAQISALPIVGTTGDDYLNGDAGNNAFDGGAGNDTLYGDAGNDTYLFNLGGGQDTIDEYDDIVGNVDTIRFGAGIAASNITFSRSGNDQVLGINGTTDQVTIQNWGYGDAYHIERVEFADGSAWDAAQLQAIAYATPIVGTEDADYLQSGAGENATLQGLGGDDSLYGNDGNNTLDGGAGNDYLTGGLGNDVYVFELGGGQDVIEDWFDVTGSIDTVQFGAGINPNDVTFSCEASDLVLGISGTSDQLTIWDWSDPNCRLERFTFTDGTIWDASYGTTNASGDMYSAIYDAQGNLISDFWFYTDGSSSTPTYNADGSYFTVVDDGNGTVTKVNYDANDVELGRSITTTYTWGDSITQNYDAQSMLINDGWQNSDGSYGTNTYYADGSSSGAEYSPDGTYYTCTEDASGNNYNYSELYYAADGTLTGSYVYTDDGMGNYEEAKYGANGNKLDDQWGHADGSWGSDTYNADGSSNGVAYNPDGSYSSYTNDGLGTISTNFFGTSGNAAGLSVSINDAQGNVVSTIYDANGNVLGIATGCMAQQVLPDGVSTIQIDSGITSAELTVSQDSQGNFLISCNDGSGTLDIPAQSAVAFPVEASFANGTSWQFINAAGNSYDYTAGSGVIYLMNPSSVQFGVGITSNMITLGLGSLMLHVGDNGDVLHIEGFNPADALNSGVLQNFKFADGTVFGYSDLLSRGFDIYGTIGDETLTGTNLNDRIYGGSGNDTLIGGVSNDTYVFNIGDGADIVVDDVNLPAGGEINTLVLGMGITAAMITPVVIASGEVSLDFGNGDSVRINQVGNLSIQRIQFADGSVIAAESLLNAPPVAVVDAVIVSEDTAQATIVAADLLANDTDPDVGDTLALSSFDAVSAQGNTVSQDAAGDLVFDIDNRYQSLGAGQTANDSFAYTVSDAAGLSSTAAVDVTVTGANDAPVMATAIADQQMDEDALFSFTVPADTFSDIDNGDTLTYSATLADGSALPAWLSFDVATQTFSGTPDNWNVGNYSVTVTATDTGGLAASSVFTVDVANVNDAPTVSMALADHAALQDAAFSFTVPAGTFDDVDFIHGDTLSYGATLADGTALPGWLSFDAATETFSGTPGNENVGILNVLVTATDTGGLSASSAFSLDVVNVNDTPTAHADTGAATEDGGAVLLDAATLLANDTDPDFIHGDALSIVGVSQAASGAAVSLVNGAVQYDPSAGSGQGIGTLFQSLAQGQTATDTFSYTVSDTAGATSTAQVAMTVTGVNDGPVTADDAAAVQEDATLVATGNVLANDSDVDQGTVLNVASAGTLQGSYGSLVLNADGSYSYALDNASSAVQGLTAGQSVTETFAYQATDGIAATPATLTVTITGVNDAPVAQNDAAAVDEDSLLAIQSSTLLANDTDADIGDTRVLVGVDEVSVMGASVSLANGSVVYDHGGQFNSLMAGQSVTDSFGYAITDSAGVASTATVSITVTGVNDGPQANGDSATIDEDAPRTTLAAASLLANDTDPDRGDTLSIAGFDSITALGNAVSMDVAGNLVFDIGDRYQSLAQGETLTDTFNYTITDTAGATSIAQVSMTIAGLNDAPVVAAPLADLSALEDQSFCYRVTGDTFSDIDQGDALTYTAMLADGSSLPSWLRFDESTLTFSGMPSNWDVGVLKVSVTAADTGNLSASCSFALNVLNVNDAPIVANHLGDQRIEEDERFSISVPDATFDDWDIVHGDSLSYSATLINGKKLPSWIRFDAATRTFSGEAEDSGDWDILLTATDEAGASASQVFNLSADNGHHGKHRDKRRDKDDNAPAIDTTQDALYTSSSVNDIFHTGNGADILVFQRGDGQDTLYGGVGTDNTLVLADGIRITDIALSKSGSDLVLEAGNDDRITLKGWYGTDANYKSVLNLAIVADAMSDFDRESRHKDGKRSIDQFDFNAVVNAFDQVCGSSATMQHWNATQSLMAAHLAESDDGDDGSPGGDLACQYGKNGSLGQTAMQEVINAAQFGSQAQSLRTFVGL